MTGGNVAANPPPSLRSSIGCSITRRSLNGDLGAGAPRSRPTCAPRWPRSRTPLFSAATPVVAGFEVSISGRFSAVHRGPRWDIEPADEGAALPENLSHAFREV